MFTQHEFEKRFDNGNLYALIGAAPKLHGSKKVNKQEFTNSNWDIDRSGPRALHIGLIKDSSILTVVGVLAPIQMTLEKEREREEISQH